LARRVNIGDYTIVVDGEFDAGTAAAFADLRVDRGDGRTTLHTGAIDQSALNGVLDRLRLVGAVLLTVDRLPHSEAS
jgi:hypothetical protein